MAGVGVVVRVGCLAHNIAARTMKRASTCVTMTLQIIGKSAIQLLTNINSFIVTGSTVKCWLDPRIPSCLVFFFILFYR